MKEMLLPSSLCEILLQAIMAAVFNKSVLTKHMVTMSTYHHDHCRAVSLGEPDTSQIEVIKY